MDTRRIRQAFRAWLIDVGMPLSGLALSIYLPITGKLEPWHLPLIGGLLGVPWIGRSPGEQEGQSEAGESGSGLDSAPTLPPSSPPATEPEKP